MFTSLSRRACMARLQTSYAKHWPIVLSAFCFYCLHTNETTIPSIALHVACILLAALLSPVVLAKYPEGVFRYLKTLSRWNHVLSFLSSLGLCVFSYHLFYNLYLPSSMLAAFVHRLGTTPGFLLTLLGLGGACGGFLAVFVGMSLLYEYLGRILRSDSPFQDLSRGEYILYGLLALALMLFTAAAFFRSTAFYGSGYNKIYSLDSGIIMNNNAYLSLEHPQNALHQPLFAVFSAPFAAIPYLLSLLFPGISCGGALLTQLTQILLLLVSYLMLAKLMRLSRRERMLFLLLCCAAYPSLLFSLAMEQYLTSVFWMILFLYRSRDGGAPDQLALTAAAGCVVISACLLPLSRRPAPWNGLTGWLKEMTARGALFLCSIVAFGRGKLLLTLAHGASNLSVFLDYNLPLLYKAQQYTAFVSSCLLTPKAAPRFLQDTGWYAWWLDPVTGFDHLGLFLLALCVVSFWLHRRQHLSQVAMGWVAVSFFVICLFGWGAAENTMVLYSMYFGWAFWVLLFQLLKTLCDQVKCPALLPIFGMALLGILLYFNLPGIASLLRFAAEYYPLIS